MGKYKIKFSKRAVKNYKKLPSGYKTLIDNELQRLSDGDRLDIVFIEGSENTFSILTGRYRILIVIQDDVAIISEIRTRGDVYK